MRIENYCDVSNGGLVIKGSLQDYIRRNIITCDASLLHQLDMLDRLGTSNIPLTIQGEPGCGKDSIAQYAHEISGRGQKPMFKINCAYLPEGEAVNELFGAGTGSNGLLRRAVRSSLYLENVAALSSQTQYRLLEHILSDQRSGEDIRYMISLQDSPEPETRLIQPLLHHFSSVTVRVPPLRERKPDILLLTMKQLHFILEQYRIERTVSPEVMASILSLDWPGNARQLTKVIDRMAFMSDATLMNSVQLLYRCLSAHSEFLPAKTPPKQQPQSKTLKELVLDYEIMLIQQYTQRYGSLRKAAAALGVSHSVLSEKLSKYKAAAQKE